MKLHIREETHPDGRQMSLLGRKLEAIREGIGCTKKAFAERVGTSASNISRWVKDDASVSEAELLGLCAAFPDDAADLVVAYLKDRLPKDLRSLVAEISPASGVAKAVDDAPPWEELSPKARRALMRAAAMVERREFLRTLQSIVDLGGGCTRAVNQERSR